MAGSANNVVSQSELYNPFFIQEWESHALYDLAEWVNGMAFKNIHFSVTGKPVIKIAEIKNGITGQTKFTEAEYDYIYHVTDGDMLFSWSGQPETSIDVFRWRGPDGWLNQHIFKVFPKEEILESYFFYLLKYLNPNFVRIAHNKQTTGLGHVTKEDLQRMQVSLPPEAEQRAIAHILGSLDDKIELNRKMNETLEAMARAIFKSWFIDFDPVRAKADLPAGRQEAAPSARPGVWFVYAIECEGGSIYIGHTEDVQRRFDEHYSGKGAEWTKSHRPIRVAYWEELPTQKVAIAREKKLKTGAGREWLKVQICKRDLLPTGLPKEIADLFPDEFEDSELGEIPKGWRVGKISNICTTQYGYTTSASDEPIGPHFLRITDMNKEPWIDWQKVPYCSINNNDLPKYILQVGDVLVSRMADPGKAAIVEENVNAVFASYLVRLKTKDLSTAYYLFYFLRSEQYLEYASGAMSGSVQAGMNAKVITAADMLIPPHDIISKFSQTICPLRHKITDNLKQSLTLASIRDTLLPKLLSGEIRVKDAERVVGEAL